MGVEQTLTQASTGGRLAELYLRHSPAGLRIAYLLTGNRTLAEDLVQEAFARLIARACDTCATPRRSTPTCDARS